MTVHRIWDFRGDQAGIVWFQKLPDGSVRVLQRLIDSGQPLAAYVHAVRLTGIEPDSIDYVRSDTKCQSLNGSSLFDAMGVHGLNPEVLPDLLWRSPTPFAMQAAA